MHGDAWGVACVSRCECGVTETCSVKKEEVDRHTRCFLTTRKSLVYGRCIDFGEDSQRQACSSRSQSLAGCNSSRPGSTCDDRSNIWTYYRSRRFFKDGVRSLIGRTTTATTDKLLQQRCCD